MRPANPRSEIRASTLLITLLAVAILSVVAGQILLGITSRLQTAHRSAAWNEALTTAESGVDMTIADVTALLPDVRINADEGVAVGVSQLPTSIISSLGITSGGLNLGQGVTLSFSPTTLTHGGEGARSQECTVSIDVLALDDILSGDLLSLDSVGGVLSNPLSLLGGSTGVKLLRIRSRGTVGIPGQRRVDPDAADAKLRRVTLVRDRLKNQKASRSSVSREVEVVLKPVFPFQNAVASGGSFNSPSPTAAFDSFNSVLATASTSGRYDVTKRKANGDLAVNSSNVTLGGIVSGDVRTSGSSIAPSGRITGTVDNSYYQPLPYIKTPTWSGSPLAPHAISGTTTLSAGTLLTPARYKFDSITGTLRISRGLLLGTNVEIWVTGNLTGRVTIDPGVTAKIYVQGNVNLAAGALTNGNERASSIQIYGINPTGPDTPTMTLALGNVTASIYAPTHAVRLTGDGDFQGSITAASFETTGAAHIHYDEALALNVGPILRYAIASWVEKEL